MRTDDGDGPCSRGPGSPPAQAVEGATAGDSSPRGLSIPAVIRSYDSPIVRGYATIRFRILRQRFLDEIEQYLPLSGRVLDVGCGFGLFALYFAGQSADRQVSGFDYNERRIAMATRSTKRLGLDNCTFTVADAATTEIDDPFDAVYMLDILHHIPRSAVAPLVARITRNLAPGGKLIVKDVADRPAHKRWFTWALDKLMDYKTPVSYWSVAELRQLLAGHGYVVHVHQMVDFLPYPHVIYVCTRAGGKA